MDLLPLLTTIILPLSLHTMDSPTPLNPNSSFLLPYLSLRLHLSPVVKKPSTIGCFFSQQCLQKSLVVQWLNRCILAKTVLTTWGSNPR